MRLNLGWLVRLGVRRMILVVGLLGLTTAISAASHSQSVSFY